MVKDRLPELEARIKSKNDKQTKKNENCDFSAITTDLFNQVDELHNDIESLEHDINTIDRLQKDILAIPQQDSISLKRLPILSEKERTRFEFFKRIGTARR
ncbi:unnamed protein product [Heterobilharzia americana]|nr:unnamed protein product [Heterobilharzia americana]